MWFFYDGLEPMSRANLDAGVGGQSIKIPQNQVEATIEEVAKNYSWGAEEETLQREVVFTNWRKLINYNIKLIN